MLDTSPLVVAGLALALLFVAGALAIDAPMFLDATVDFEPLQTRAIAGVASSRVAG